MNPTVVAAAWLILTGQVPAHVQVPLPTEPQTPVTICPAPNHLTIRWVGDRRRHHHHHKTRLAAVGAPHPGL